MNEATASALDVPCREERVSPSPLVFADLESRLASLDALPKHLWLWTLVHSIGTVEPRLAGIHQLRDALATGVTPVNPDWPDTPLAEAASAALRDLDLPQFCAEKPELADQVTQSLLWHLDRIVDYRDLGDGPDAAIAKALGDFAEDWRERCGLMAELTEVFGDFGDLDKNTRWDVMRGVLKSAAWAEVLRVRALIERIPDLVAVIRRLGRARPAEVERDELADDPRTFTTVTAPRASRRTTRVPDLPGETRGITRADRIARMLPAESMLLAHRRLRLVWHARHAERALLCYDDDDRLEEELPQSLPTPLPSPRPRLRQRPEAGPMLVCVDTSGSMQGAAEAVAKAVVLEAARTAFAEGRHCHVYAFGGNDELIEFTVSRDAEGIARLAEFLGQSFSGGTDICTPLTRTLEAVTTGAWRQADLLIASDGEFGATPEIASQVAEAKRAMGLRIQGVLIGDRETIGFLEIADDILWVRDWRLFGNQASARSPVHSQRLTAMYFPGALRGTNAKGFAAHGSAPGSATPGDTAAGTPDAAQAFRQPMKPRR